MLTENSEHEHVYSTLYCTARETHVRRESDRQAVLLRDLVERVEQVEVREPPVDARSVRVQAAARARLRGCRRRRRRRRGDLECESRLQSAAARNQLSGFDVCVAYERRSITFTSSDTVSVPYISSQAIVSVMCNVLLNTVRV